MFKFLKRLLCIGIILSVIFIVIAILSGGDKFRWFGKKVKETTEQVAEKADTVKEKVEGVRGKAGSLYEKTEKEVKQMNKGKKK